VNRTIQILAFVTLVILSSALPGCGNNDKKETDANKTPAGDSSTPPAAAVTNKLSAPAWKKHTFDKDGYQLDLPGEPKTETMSDFRGLVDRNRPLQGYRVVSFTDSDLELLTFVMPEPKKPYRSLEHFYQEFNPVMPTKDNAPLGDVTKEEHVTVDGKKGIEFTIARKQKQTAGPETILYRAFLADKKVYILAASGKKLDKHKSVIDRVFDSLRIDGKQPASQPVDGKPVNLAEYWKTINGIPGDYTVEMPGTSRMDPKKGKGNSPEFFTSVDVFGTDLQFSVNAIRQDKRSPEAAKKSIPAKFGAKLTKDEMVLIDGKEGLQLTMEAGKEVIICRFVSLPGNYGYEIAVMGSQLQDYQADIDRFFKSFKFVDRNKK
jgi:hypothetical protein